MQIVCIKMSILFLVKHKQYMSKCHMLKFLLRVLSINSSPAEPRYDLPLQTV